MVFNAVDCKSTFIRSFKGYAPLSIPPLFPAWNDALIAAIANNKVRKVTVTVANIPRIEMINEASGIENRYGIALFSNHTRMASVT